MTRRSQLGGAKPIRTFTYTSGTGTFTPLMPNSICKIVLQGAGAGGSGINSTQSCPGTSGARLEVTMRVSGATAYSIGAAGLGGVAGASTSPTNGGDTTFGMLVAPGGIARPSASGLQDGPAYGQGGVFTAGESVLAAVGRGGNSLYGAGGAANGGNATGYGAGGGSANNATGGNGSGGLIIIEEYGA